MNSAILIQELQINKGVLETLLIQLPQDAVLFKTQPEKWCMLEVVCHLYDEEREDFRARLKHVLETPALEMPSIDPVGWVKERAYMEKDFNNILQMFLNERNTSIDWLQNLGNVNWEQGCIHPKFGKMTAKMFLSNWLAHDYLHIRQLMGLKFNYLKQLTGETLTYSGGW